MFQENLVRVITAEKSNRSILLAKIFNDPRWTDAVQRSDLHAHYLTCMTYDEFVRNDSSRVLSYRWNEKIRLDCDVSDPADLVVKFRGEIALSVLQTPLTDWKYLWADALNHLNDPLGVIWSIKTMGQLYLEVTVLPQYFLRSDFNGLNEALGRGWMHQEIAYGSIDKLAIRGLIGICAKELPSRWRGNPFYVPSLITFQHFMSKRVRSAWTRVHEGSEFAKLLKDENPSASYTSDLTYSAVIDRVMSYWLKLNDCPSNIYQYGHHVDKDICEKLIKEFITEVSSKQLSDSTEDNFKLLQENPSFCVSILKAASNTNFWDKSDAYVASIAVVGSACGIPVGDPLEEYKAKHGSNLPRNDDFTMKYTVLDINLATLNSNLSLLRTCWHTLNTPNLSLPYAFRGMTEDSKIRYSLRDMPPGMHTLGVGLLLNSAGSGDVEIQVTCNYSLIVNGEDVVVEKLSASKARSEPAAVVAAPFVSIKDLYNPRFIQSLSVAAPAFNETSICEVSAQEISGESPVVEKSGGETSIRSQEDGKGSGPSTVTIGLLDYEKNIESLAEVESAVNNAAKADNEDQSKVKQRLYEKITEASINVS
jgi:hypothetical protein